MSELTEFQQRAVAAGIVKLFARKHFDVCDFDALTQIMGRESQAGGKDRASLRLVHCMDWADMGPDLTRQVREKCLEILGLPAETINVLAAEKRAEPPSEPAKRLRLAFWR